MDDLWTNHDTKGPRHGTISKVSGRLHSIKGTAVETVRPFLVAQTVANFCPGWRYDGLTVLAAGRQRGTRPR